MQFQAQLISTNKKIIHPHKVKGRTRIRQYRTHLEGQTELATHKKLIYSTT